ncbi:hypothetical protein F4802DRAFT_71913 [Xylaria palmicola]|nr:hypothetical protein F4802DRAFT_71913 [Xylaria palmicola]
MPSPADGGLRSSRTDMIIMENTSCRRHSSTRCLNQACCMLRPATPRHPRNDAQFATRLRPIRSSSFCIQHKKARQMSIPTLQDCQTRESPRRASSRSHHSPHNMIPETKSARVCASAGPVSTTLCHQGISPTTHRNAHVQTNTHRSPFSYCKLSFSLPTSALAWSFALQARAAYITQGCLRRTIPLPRDNLVVYIATQGPTQPVVVGR